MKLRAGATLPPVLARELRNALPIVEEIPDTIGDAVDWIGADDVKRGASAYQLLDFGHYFPQRRRPERLAFPRILSRPS